MHQYKDKLVHEQLKTQQVVEKMEQMKLELKMLESNDTSVAAIWKKKCLDLFEVCQTLKTENEEIERIYDVEIPMDTALLPYFMPFDIRRKEKRNNNGEQKASKPRYFVPKCENYRSKYPNNKSGFCDYEFFNIDHKNEM